MLSPAQLEQLYLMLGYDLAITFQPFNHSISVQNQVSVAPVIIEVFHLRGQVVSEAPAGSTLLVAAQAPRAPAVGPGACAPATAGCPALVPIGLQGQRGAVLDRLIGCLGLDDCLVYNDRMILPLESPRRYQVPCSPHVNSCLSDSLVKLFCG